MSVIPELAHGYTPPGTYIAEQSQPISTATGLPEGRLTILGRGQGAQRSTEQVPLRAEGTRLAVKGINQASITVTVVSDETVLDASNYTVTQVPLTETDRDYWTEIGLVTTGGEDGDNPGEEGVPEGTTVWVSYTFIPVDYYTPRLFTQPADVSDMYGPSMNWSGDPLDPDYAPVNSPITLACEIAFANGAAEILVVPLNLEPTATPDQVRAALQSGYTKVESDYASGVVVPLTDGLDADTTGQAASELRGHLIGASNSGYYRVGIFGPPLAYAASPAALVNNSGLSHRRLLVAYGSPEGMLYRSNASGERIFIGHQYLAAAYGGRMVSLPVQQSLTRQPVTGFAGLGATVSTTTKNAWAAAGVALSETNRQGRLIVRHGTTTDRSDLISSEPSLTRARDVMVSMIQTGLDNSNLVGSAMDDMAPISVKSVVAGVLEFCQASGTIVAYSNLQARILSANPSVIEVRFGYRPSFPLNYIQVNFAVDLNTGDTTDATQTAVNA